VTCLKTEPTFSARIFVGLQEGYDGPLHKYKEVVSIAQHYCDDVGLGVNISETTFVYTGGREPGVCVELIQYPRFPNDIDLIKKHAFRIAKMLMEAFNQHRCSVVCTDLTYLIEKKDLLTYE